MTTPVVVDCRATGLRTPSRPVAIVGPWSRRHQRRTSRGSVHD
jgi:hypothetical protein